MVITTSWASAYFRDAVCAVHERDWVAFERLHQSDVHYVSPLGHCVGPVAVKQLLQDSIAAVRDLSIRLVRMTTDGVNNRSVFELVTSGTSTGDPTNPTCVARGPQRMFDLSSVMVVSFDSQGLATELRSYFDTGELQRQLARTV